MKRLSSLFSYLVLIVKGALVGFGAILPGVSGGTLCAAFGMYRPIIDLLSHPIKTLKKDGLRLFFFVLGGGIGFIGLAGLAAWLLAWNPVVVTCVFVGFIIGTLPELWKTAGEEGRKTSSFVSMAAGFAVLLTLLILIRSFALTLNEGFGAWMLCGGFWGASFIVPGLSSSNFIMFFGLYEQMMAGISNLDIPLLLPLGLGFLLCVVILPTGVNYLLSHRHSQFSHLILGLVVASTVMIVPLEIFASGSAFFIALCAVIGGCAVSFGASKGCEWIAKRTEESESEAV